MLVLYPPIKPNATYELAVEPPHVLYLEESGNPQGIPVIFLHGGPGSGCKEDHRRFFDPQIYRIILFDQRGAGRSTPHAALVGNNTAGLVSDIEAIRLFLKIDSFVVFGGSWGSTLALIYAETYPEKVKALILRGIFLGREEDLQWFYQFGGASRVFPDAWQEFVKELSPEEQLDIVGSYYKRLTSNNELMVRSAVNAWARWGGECATLQPDPKVVSDYLEPFSSMSLARIETHYFVNKCFLQPNQIIQNAHQLNQIPGIIVHGRYDMVCALENAFTLQKAWPLSNLQIIRDAGHSSSEPGMTSALIAATNTIGHQLLKK